MPDQSAHLPDRCVDLTAGAACRRHGTAWCDDCTECDDKRHPVPYDPVPSQIWRQGQADAATTGVTFGDGHEHDWAPTNRTWTCTRCGAWTHHAPQHARFTFD